MDLLTEEQLDALRRELRQSQAAQDWSPGSTRSQWADDLANILDLHDRLSIALDKAQEKQVALTTKVAKRLAEDAVALADACAYATMRSIDPYQDPGYVTVDLLDGEVEVRIP